MSYKYITQFDSPNFTPPNQVFATWGRPRTFEAIAIHWWGDPNQEPTLQTTINTLINPNRGASAHFVASGTDREVAQLVDMANASWATNSANPYTISIECDPRCRDEDYDVVAELIANIRSVYGNLPLVPHRQFVATTCPGNYDLARLDALAHTKDGSGEFGNVTDNEEIMNEPQDIRNIGGAIWGREVDEQTVTNLTGKSWHDVVYYLLQAYPWTDRVQAEAQNAAEVATLTEKVTELQKELDERPIVEQPVETSPTVPEVPSSGTENQPEVPKRVNALLKFLKDFFTNLWNS